MKALGVGSVVLGVMACAEADAAWDFFAAHAR